MVVNLTVPLRLSIVYLMTWTLASDLKHWSKETTPLCFRLISYWRKLPVEKGCIA